MAENGLLDPGVATAIERTKRVKQEGVREGNWLLQYWELHGSASVARSSDQG